MPSPEFTSLTTASVDEDTTAKLEPGSPGAFAKLLEGFAHTPKVVSQSRTSLSRTSSTSKRKFAETSEVKLEVGQMASPSPSPTKKSKKVLKDEGWRESRSVHDYLRPGLDGASFLQFSISADRSSHVWPVAKVVFCGINPGRMSATAGRHFANPGNHFWSCLHEGGAYPHAKPT